MHSFIHNERWKSRFAAAFIESNYVEMMMTTTKKTSSREAEAAAAKCDKSYENIENAVEYKLNGKNDDDRTSDDVAP